MKKRLEGIQFGRLVFNAIIVASVIIALTSGYQIGWD
jgi:hypothetical protein